MRHKSQGVEVAPTVDMVGRGLLRAHVLRRADYLAHPGEPFGGGLGWRGDDAGDAEVHDAWRGQVAALDHADHRPAMSRCTTPRPCA